MTSWKDSLLDSEKVLIRKYALVCFMILVLSLTLSFRLKSNFNSLKATAVETAARFEEVSAKLAREKEAGLKWAEAENDLKMLSSNYFYPQDAAIPALRLSLEEIFNQTGLPYYDLKYSYSESSQDMFGKIGVSFNFAGSYGDLKKLIFAVEKYPKFLTIENLDFLDVSSGPLKVRFTLAGYYEKK